MGDRRSERWAALLEAAITIPLLLLIAVGTLEFGRAYQTWQVLTNAAREGARVAVLPGQTVTSARQRVRDYMAAGQLSGAQTATVNVNQSATLTVNGSAVSASQVTVNYPFSFIALQGVANLISGGNSFGSLMITADAVMRNETQ
jgi:Flp pilus assembly protein TadG